MSENKLIVDETWPLKPRQVTRLSWLQENQAGDMDGRRFIVRKRCPEDRCSGSCKVIFEDGAREVFIWDVRDPVVVFLGDGNIEVGITFPEGDKKAVKTVWDDI